jgi:hypothetical protein
MNQEPRHEDLLPPNAIRIESALSRFPVHQLTQRSQVNIEIRETNDDGELKTKWKVSYNSEYGQPGALAYKVDTLAINRKFDEIGRPLPALIKLDSLRAIAKELGSNPIEIKKAFRQNARAFITAKISYKRKDGAEITREADFTRYSLIFTGETLPDGRKADAVYLLLNEIYREILNTAQTRPLDYDYLRELSPGAQRFYELLSFQIFGALANERPRAKMLYSYYCTRAPQTRYFDYDHVKKQMYKVHAPHKKSGYISAVELRETTDGEGRADWEMLYTPGRKAKAEFRAFNEPSSAVSKRRRKPEQLPLPAPTNPEPPSPTQIMREAEPQEIDPFVTKLVSFHLTETTARELVRDYRKSVEMQLQALPHRNTGKIKDLAPWLIKAIRENYELPEEMKHALEKEAEVKRQVAKREAARARQSHREALQPIFYEYLRGREGEHQIKRPEAYRAFLAKEAGERAEIENNRIFKPKFKAHQLDIFDHEESHLDRLRAYFNELTLDDWLEHNPHHRS